MDFILRSARYIAENTMRSLITEGDCVIDATVGNGYDTCILASLVGDRGHVWGFDIQQSAIDSTQKKLISENLIHRCTLICDGHQNMLRYVSGPVKAVFFNLGWLPGGNKAITTLWETTREAVSAALQLIEPLGIVSVCAYPGHEEGDHERHELIAMLEALRPQEFNVLEHRFLNAGSGAPECFLIQKQNIS